MQVQTTALTTLMGALVMFGAGYLVNRSIHRSTVPTLRPIQLFRGFFIYMGVFFACMWLPNLALTTTPDAFPLAMAWGYVIGHIFAYLAFMTIAQMLCTMVPWLASRERWVVVVGVIVAVAQTLLNGFTMILGTQPTYNYERSLVQYNTFPLVGVGIGVVALLTILPAGGLFLAHAIRNPARRLRSALLGVGFMLMTVAGPLHDVATTWQTYATADGFTILSILLIGAGVIYRLDQSL